MKIYDKIKDDKQLKEIITEQNDGNRTIITINIDISIYLQNVEFNGDFKLWTITNGGDIIKIAFNKAVQMHTITFNKETAFKGSTFEEGSFLSCYGVVFKEKADFSRLKFEKNVSANFGDLIFEKEAFFGGSEYGKEANFIKIVFKKEVKFTNSTFNTAKFEISIFESIALFTDISFNLLIFSECIFEYITHFKRKNKNNTKYFAIFHKSFFAHEQTIIENFLLSKTSFLLTDMRKTLILCEIENKKILSHKLLNDDINLEYANIKQNLNYEPVLAEYRNLRLSMENNRTYIEASELFKKEMDLIKEHTNPFEKLVIWLYEALSNYGESMFKPFAGMIFFVFMFPVPFLVWEYNFVGYLNHTYIGCLFDTLRAFFQLGIKDKYSLMYNYEWLIRIISLILLGSLFIAIKRRLERK